MIIFIEMAYLRGVIGFTIFLFAQVPVFAGNLVVEHTDDFSLTDALYSAKLTVVDFDADGRDDIIISDDYGSFHIFTLHDGKFEELWISDPLDVETGSIKWLGATGGTSRQGRVFVLDSKNRLHMYSYDGYILGESSSWSIPTEGYLIDAAIIQSSSGDSFEFLQLAIVPGNKFVVTTYTLGDEMSLTRPALGVDAAIAAIPAITVEGGGKHVALLTIKGKGNDETSEEQFSLEIASTDGSTIDSLLLDGFNPEEEAIALVALDIDSKIVAFGFGAPDDMGHLKMRVWREDEDMLNS